MEHLGNAYNGLVRYFNALENIGYYDPKETQNLAIYSFIVNEIFEGPLEAYLDNEGLASINKALRCIYKGCLINPVMDNIKLSEPHVRTGYNRFRHSETDILRSTEQNNVRPIEYVPSKPGN